MVRSGLSLYVLLILIVPMTLSGLAAHAQDSPSPDEAPAVAQPSDDAIESATGDIAASLPEDIPTRETYEEREEGTPQVGPGLMDYLRIFGGLAIVLLVIWGISVLMKRFIQVRGLATSTESLKVLYTMSLTPTRMQIGRAS